MSFTVPDESSFFGGLPYSFSASVLVSVRMSPSLEMTTRLVTPSTTLVNTSPVDLSIIAVIEAMIDKSTGLVLTNVVDGVTNRVVISKEGDILTLTNTEAEKEYGNPPKKLLSSGTVKDIDALLKLLGYDGAERHDIKVTGMEKIGSWLNAISPLLLIIGVVGIYIEMKTPGFGIAGIIGISAFVLYFLGGYAAGLSGLEWIVVFVIGLALVIVELFVYPGH